MNIFLKLSKVLLAVTLLSSITSCEGLFSGVYDEPVDDTRPTLAGTLYIDASDWTKWHYIDLPSLAKAVENDPGFNTSSLWISEDIPLDGDPAGDPQCGIYTYWYDVFGEGISKNEFRGFKPTAPQKEPSQWTFAVHRNNVRTNGCMVASTDLKSFDDLPADKSFYNRLGFRSDEFNEKDVWVIQDRMLLGIIGNQGIKINPVLSSWLNIEIPPMPPEFTLDSRVYVLKLQDGSLAALQLHNYIGSTGTKCCLTINYRYPL